ncbi:NAD-binding protein [Kitasatospora sp. NPDC096147]|uniref:NAD-binding protein n=1 Tax=Kitasatospora sp. NPDC096147 TaxID=3364093 RepID=UPI003827642B
MSHYLVCGGNALAHRLIRELIEHYDVPVVALVPDLTQDHGPRISQIPGLAAVHEYPAISAETLRACGIEEANGIALVDGTDQGNIHAAMAAEGLNPGIRIVLRMYNQRLGQHIERLLPNCTSLSGSATAAPAFANGALERPNSVHAGGRYLYVAYDEEIRDNQLCVVADGIDPQDLGRLRLLPDTAGRAAEFIALARRFGDEGQGGPPPPPPPGHEPGGLAALQALTERPPLRIPWWTRLRWRVLDALRFFTSARLRLLLTVALVAVLLGGAVIWWSTGHLGWALYYTLLDVAGAADPDRPGDSPGDGSGPWARAAQVVVTFCGITFAPVATAIAVEALATGRRGLPRGPGAGLRDHVVVVGLNNLGTRVAGMLRETGVPVVCVERDPQSRGIAAMRALGVPVLVGDAPLAGQLRRARVQHARAVVSVTRDDAANLEAALEARAIHPEIRIVCRLFDDDFAHHVYATLGNVVSRSVSYLSAPGFAAALMGREVLGTLSVFRHVLLLAELTAEDGSGLIGRTVWGLEEPGGVRVVGVRLARRPGDVLWNFADRGYRLRAGDRVLLAATRIGLARLGPAPAEPPPAPGPQPAPASGPQPAPASGPVGPPPAGPVSGPVPEPRSGGAG